MGKLTIKNKRPLDTNIQKNRVAPPQHLVEFKLDKDIVHSRDERDALKAALEVFTRYVDMGLKMADRDFERDQELAFAAKRIMGRI